MRGGYGRTGNANIGSFTYVNSIALNKNYASGSTPHIRYAANRLCQPGSYLGKE
jgi:hypothetical protein